MIYVSYSDTHYERTNMLKALFMAAKIVVGLGLTLAIGYIAKLEIRVDDAIDAYAETKTK